MAKIPNTLTKQSMNEASISGKIIVRKQKEKKWPEKMMTQIPKLSNKPFFHLKNEKEIEEKNGRKNWGYLLEAK